MRPNLFAYAMKELSQDAMICWLLAWADPGCEGDDPALHALGKSLVGDLLRLHDVALPERVGVTVHRQLIRADIVAEIGANLVLLIEDKVHASLHGDQLERYLREIKDRFTDRRVLPIFLKTGDQSSYTEVEKAGYKLFLRMHLLELLRPWRGRVSNAIFSDFLSNLEWRESEVESYRVKPAAIWTDEWDPWIGFYKYLQHEISSAVEWDYVPNASGGFLGAWWNFTPWLDRRSGSEYDVYLQIEQGPLCFKIAVGEKDTDRASLWERWFEVLAATASNSNFNLVRARRRPGAWMTVGRVEMADWMACKSDGLIDLDRTLIFLQSAASILDRASAPEPICP